MIAHLQNGEYNGVRILKPETAHLMHSRVWTNLPELNGGCYGFYEQSLNGHRSIGHGGDTQWFHSDMFLMVDDNVGVSVSFNSAGKGEFSLRDALWEHFMDRYFPYPPPATQKAANSASDARSVVGTYWGSQRSQTNIAAVTELKGEGAPQDTVAAFRWFTKAADQGHTGAEIELGYMYARAIGTEENLAAAYSWLLAASTAGDHRGDDLMHSLQGRLTAAQVAAARDHARKLTLPPLGQVSANAFAP